MFPRVAIVDPELTYDLPPSLTAMTGLGVYLHVVDCCTGEVAGWSVELRR